MYRFRLYIPFGGDITLLNTAINSVVAQIDEFSCYEGKKIVVMNNTLKPIAQDIQHIEYVDVWELPFELMHAQQMNWMLKDCVSQNLPICIQLHTDAELLPGAMKAAIAEYERIKDMKWFAFGVGIDSVFVTLNPQFFVQENVWYDAFLFPFYYMDNHIGRIAKMRGWYDNTVGGNYIKHVRSHFLKTNNIFNIKNSIMFKYHGKIYEKIWGGLPGRETINDPYAGGTLKKL